ncbi:MAG: YciK family oxidoreductase [Candidatus Dasytiphilus stammeri]
MNYNPKIDLLNNKIILVTGASSGIGREAALTYARYGATLVLLGRNSEKLQKVVHEIHQRGKPAHYYILDFKDYPLKTCRDIAKKIANHYSIIDGILHNAGMLGEIASIEKQSPMIWQQVMNVNVNATFFLTQALLPLLLRSSSSSVILTSSSVGRKGRARWGAYSVSKFATEGLMQVLADEYQGSKLRVNCINPGRIRTKMRAHAFPEENADLLKKPADIMPIYLYLMGEDSIHENGISFDAQSYHYQEN